MPGAFMNSGMSTLSNKSKSDPIEVMIFDKGLRIKTLFIEKDLDLLIVVLNNGNVIKSKISVFPKLTGADLKQLQKWELRNEGIGIHWEELDEDLSLYGFIKELGTGTKIKQLLLKTRTASLL
jgi:hypothetical protein